MHIYARRTVHSATQRDAKKRKLEDAAAEKVLSGRYVLPFSCLYKLLGMGFGRLIFMQLAREAMILVLKSASKKEQIHKNLRITHYNLLAKYAHNLLCGALYSKVRTLNCVFT
jgi:hypothetical protein